MAGGSLFRQAVSALAVAGTTATGPLISLGTSPTFTFGIAGNTITGSAVGAAASATGSVFGHGNTITNVPFVSSQTQDYSSVVYRGEGIASVGFFGGSIVVSVPSGGGGLTQATLYATGNTTQSTTGTQALSSILFRGEGIASVGVSGGSVVVSVPPGAPSPVNFSAGTTSQNLGSVVFSNSNGVVFGLNGSTITASVTNVTIQAYAESNTTVSSEGTLNSSSLMVAGLGIVSVGYSTALGPDTLVISATQSNQAFSASGGSSAFQTLGFENANGFTFSNVGGSVRGSYTVPTVTNSSMTVSDAATSGTLARLAFTNLNGVTLSLSTGAGGSHTIVGSHNGLTSQSNQAASAANGSFAFQTVSFSNANGFSFATSAGSAIVGSYTVPTVTNSSMTVSDAATSGTLARLAFTNLNGVTLSLSTGAGGSHTIVGSHNALTSQSNQAFSAAGGSSAFQTLGFSDNGAGSFTNTNGSVAIASIRASLFAVSNTTQSSSGTQNLNAISFAGAGDASVGVTNGTVVISVPVGGGGGLTQATLYATGNTTQSTTGTQALSSLLFRGEGLASVGITNGSVVVSVPAGAPSPVNFSAGTTSNNLGSVVFSNSGGVTFGLDGSTITARIALDGFASSNTTVSSAGTLAGSSMLVAGFGAVSVGFSTGIGPDTLVVSAPATSSLSATGLFSISTNGSTISMGVPMSTLEGYDPHGLGAEYLMGQLGNASHFVMPLRLHAPIQFDQFVIKVNNTNSSNSSGSHTLSVMVGLYTRNASTLSRLQSTVMTTAVTHSGTAGSYSLYSGLRNLRLGWTSTLTGGNYWVAVATRTSSAGANGSYSQLLLSNIGSNISGDFGAANNASEQWQLGLGLFSVSSSAPPASIAFSDIAGTGQANLRAPVFHFESNSF